MPLPNVIDFGFLFNGAYADNTQQTSAEVHVSDQRSQLTVVFAPVGTNMTHLAQIQDPSGTWTTVDTATTNDGAVDELTMPNAGSVRVLHTSSTGTGTARIWAKASGS